MGGGACIVAIQVQFPDISVGEKGRDDVFRDWAVDRASREKALLAVNTTLIDLHWEVGATISRKIEAAEWGDGMIEQLAEYELTRRRHGGLRKPTPHTVTISIRSYLG
jgi:hypothetical protein